MNKTKRTALCRKRARELRALNMTYQAIADTMTAEGMPISKSGAYYYAHDVACAELRGRPKTAEASHTAASRQQKADAWRAYYSKHKERINAHIRAKRAAETPTERAERLEYQRLMYEANKEQINARIRARRASETPEERAKRLQYFRAYRNSRKAQA